MNAKIKKTRTFFRIVTPEGYSDLHANTLTQAIERKNNFGTTDKDSEYFKSAVETRKACTIEQVEETTFDVSEVSFYEFNWSVKRGITGRIENL